MNLVVAIVRPTSAWSSSLVGSFTRPRWQGLTLRSACRSTAASASTGNLGAAARPLRWSCLRGASEIVSRTTSSSPPSQSRAPRAHARRRSATARSSSAGRERVVRISPVQVDESASRRCRW